MVILRSFTVHHPDNSGSTTIGVSDSDDKLTININGIHKPHILKVNINKMPRRIELDGRQLSDSTDYSFNRSSNKLVIRTSEYVTGNYSIFK